jgi:hypothetical protein
VQGGNNGVAGGDYTLIVNNYNATSGTAAGVVSFRVGGGVLPGITINPTAGTTAYNTSSDERLKSEFEDFDAVSILNKILIGKYKRLKNTEGEYEYGCSAQQLETVYKHPVVRGVGELGDEEFMPWGVDYSTLVPLSMKAIQELSAKVEAQKLLLGAANAEISALKSA